MKTVVATDSIINRKNLIRIKQFILLNKQTRTFSQMFNNNPFYKTERYEFYLIPDPGGPNIHPQWNINCDPSKGDFNTIIVRKNIAHFQSHEDFLDQYRRLSFAGPDVQIVNEYDDSAGVDAVKLTQFPEDAIQELLDIVHKKSGSA
jgi:hypothetical protein